MDNRQQNVLTSRPTQHPIFLNESYVLKKVTFNFNAMVGIANFRLMHCSSVRFDWYLKIQIRKNILLRESELNLSGKLL